MIRIKNPIAPRLPSEYQEVEYIESTGTQYIDTGVLPSASIYIEDLLAISSSCGVDTLNGAENSSVSNYRFKWGAAADGRFHIGYGANNYTATLTRTLDDFYLYKIGVGIQEVVGVMSYSNTATLNYANKSILLFQMRGGGSGMRTTVPIQAESYTIRRSSIS